MQGMSIPAVGMLMTKCWMSAEMAVRRECHDTDEEFVTTLFRLKLADQVAAASAGGAVESAFLEDLRHAFPSAPNESLSRIAYGLVATVSFPDHSVESQTGGDLGILLVRPDVRQVRYGSSHAIVDRDYKRGLLCQAKMFRRGSKWGRLTDNQERILPTKLDYFALLLYRFTDHEGDRRELGPFFWQVTHKKTVEAISGWLASDNFPELLDSARILDSLIADEIGTDDEYIIETDIAPKLRRALVIRIGWPDGAGPGSTVEIQQSTVVRQYVVNRH